MDAEIEALLSRSNDLGSDRRVTNYGGGNTSVKVTLPDPITGAPTRVLVVKGSGGDLGTLTESGLAQLVLDRVLALEAVHADGLHEDDIVGLYEHCQFAGGGPVPSIDTPLHAFLDAAHVDHLHPDAVIALAAAADGEALVAECFGGDVGWLAWKRPGFELGLALRDRCRRHPAEVGVVLGGHGVIAWGETSDECEATSRSIIERAEAFLHARGSATPFGGRVEAMSPLDAADRLAEAVRLGPVVRGLASHDRAMVGHFSDAPTVLDFLAHEAAPRLAALGTSCPDHFLRTKVRPLVLDLPPSAPFDERVERLRELHAAYREEYAAYYDAHAVESSPAMRGADPAIVLLPGIGMWSFGADSRTARVAGEFYVNAINVMRGAESVSSYAPISDDEKFRIEYWELEERKLQMQPPAPALRGRVGMVTGGASGIGRAIVDRLAAAGACVVVADLDLEGAEKLAAGIGAAQALAVAVDVGNEAAVEAAFDAAVLRFGGVDLVVNNAGLATSTSLVETTSEEWDRLHQVLSRGSFLVSRRAAQVMIASGRGGDIVYIVSKNGVVAGPQNVAYGAAKADQAHQVRLLAAELGRHGIRVNGINPDGVVQGSGIFTGEWLEQRAAAHGVDPEQLSSFYASRTLLGLEVLPHDVAEAVVVLTSGQLSRTTGAIIPVDGGIAAAFLR